MLDLVPNHTSDQHPWFLDAISSRRLEVSRLVRVGRSEARRLAAQQLGDGVRSARPAWTFDEASGQYYLNQFLSSQPDLNWWNDDVRDAFDAILRFWFDRGVAGFRIDVCHSIIKDRELRDNPPATKDDHWWVQMRGQRSVYNACRPEVHDVLRRWRKLADGYDPHRVLIGETYVLDPTQFGAVLRRRRRAQPRVQLHAAALEVRRGRAPRRRSSTPKEHLPATRVAGVDGRQSRQPPVPDALVRRRSRQARVPRW